MQTQYKHALRRRMIRPLIASLTATAGCAVWADEPSPYYLGVTESLTSDSNATGTAGGRSDTYSSTGLTGGFDQPIGRQRLHANANVHYNKYHSLTQLDSTTYGVAGGWDWATIEQLSGNVLASANQSPASLGTTAGLVNTASEKNLAKTDQLSTSVLWGGATVGLQGAYSHSRVRYSAASYFVAESSADAGSANVFYRLGPDIKLGTGVRVTRTISPHAIYTPAAGLVSTDPNVIADPANYSPNTATGRNFDLTADWGVTAQSGVNARLSWTRQSNSTVAGNLDFSGLTGSLGVRYAPTGKLTFGASVNRDAGTNSSFFNVPPTTSTGSNTSTTSSTGTMGLAQNTQTTNSYSLTAGYAATAKISVVASADRARAKVVNTAVIDGATVVTDGTDASHSYAIGVDYNAARNWRLGCKASHMSRILTSATSTAYSNDSVGCSAQFTLR